VGKDPSRPGTEGSAEPAWALIPFRFVAQSVELSGFFRIVWGRSGSPLFMGAEFSAGGHSYSLSLEGERAALDLEGGGGAEAALYEGLSPELSRLGFRLEREAAGGMGSWTDVRA
jgi:hypothetical protein